MFTIENSNINKSNNETNKSTKYQEKEKKKKKKYKLFLPLDFPRYIRESCEYCTQYSI